MDEAEIEIAIQPFRQIDNGLTRRHEGTGLGHLWSRPMPKRMAAR